MHVPDTMDRIRLPDSSLAAALLSARDRLAGRTAARIGESGLVPSPCHSRVLESALALLLVDRIGHLHRRPELAGYLEARSRTEPQQSLERVLAECALHGIPLPERVLATALTGFDHFTSGRKHSMLQAIAVVFGRRRAGISIQPADRAGLHPWASAMVTASEVIIKGEADAAQRAELTAVVDRPGIWDGHLLCHLLCTHALTLLPGTGTLVARSARRVLATQQPDGGIPFIQSLDLFCTALAGLGLAVAGPEHRPALVATADALAQRQRDNGGWAYASGVDLPDLDTTAVALELLAAVDAPRYAPRISAGMAFLHELRGADGGFPTYLPGARSEVAMTAAAANALELNPHGAQALADAARFIIARQSADGSFEPGWSRSTANTLCRVLLALTRADAVSGLAERAAIRAAITRSGHRLVHQQNGDGGWGHVSGEESDPISTAFALIGLARFPGGTVAVPAGLRYLLAQQGLDGGFVSRPDSTGPRGFVYDVPVLADLYPLLAMGHLTDSAPVLVPV